MQQPPPPGVSAVDENNNHKPIVADKVSVPVGNKRNGRKVRRGDDPLEHPEDFKVLQSNTVNPTGVGTVQRDIREGKMPKSQRPRRNMASFESIDGQVYTFRTHDSKGKALPTRISQCLFLALIEKEKGGSPFTVMNAFKLTMNDADDKAMFPVPEHVLNSLQGDDEAFVADEDFNLGHGE